jgi:hypothetical protein
MFDYFVFLSARRVTSTEHKRKEIVLPAAAVIFKGGTGGMASFCVPFGTLDMKTTQVLCDD